MRRAGVIARGRVYAGIHDVSQMVVAWPVPVRTRRENVRWRPRRLFEHDVKPVQVVHQLRVSTKSAYQWRRRWRAWGRPRWYRKARAGRYARRPAQPAGCGARAGEWPGCLGVGRGPAVDAGRITTLIGRWFHVLHTLRGTSYLLNPIG